MRLWLRFLSLLKPYRGRLLITFLATLARPLLNAAKIYLLKLIVDNLARSPSSQLVLDICVALPLCVAGCVRTEEPRGFS